MSSFSGVQNNASYYLISAENVRTLSQPQMTLGDNGVFEFDYVLDSSGSGTLTNDAVELTYAAAGADFMAKDLRLDLSATETVQSGAFLIPSAQEFYDAFKTKYTVAPLVGTTVGCLVTLSSNTKARTMYVRAAAAGSGITIREEVRAATLVYSPLYNFTRSLRLVCEFTAVDVPKVLVRIVDDDDESLRVPTTRTYISSDVTNDTGAGVVTFTAGGTLDQTATSAQISAVGSTVVTKPSYVDQPITLGTVFKPDNPHASVNLTPSQIIGTVFTLTSEQAYLATEQVFTLPTTDAVWRFLEARTTSLIGAFFEFTVVNAATHASALSFEFAPADANTQIVGSPFVQPQTTAVFRVVLMEENGAERLMVSRMTSPNPTYFGAANRYTQLTSITTDVSVTCGRGEITLAGVIPNATAITFTVNLAQDMLDTNSMVFVTCLGESVTTGKPADCFAHTYVLTAGSQSFDVTIQAADVAGHDLAGGAPRVLYTIEQ